MVGLSNLLRGSRRGEEYDVVDRIENQRLETLVSNRVYTFSKHLYMIYGMFR